MKHLVVASSVMSVGLALFACTETTTGSGSPGGASTQQVDQCKASCDKMKFFQCNSAEEQARCYNDCNTAAPSQIEVFNGCAQNSICDPSCRTSITPKQPSGSGTGTVSGGGGASEGSCTSACDKLASCSFIKVGDKAACAQACATEAYQYQIDCVNNTECSKMKAQCGNVTGGETTTSSSTSTSSTTSSGTSGTSSGQSEFDIKVCQDACDGLQFFDCIDATTQAECRDKCTTATKAKRDTFTSCRNGAGSDCTKGQDCYAVFSK